MEFNVGKVDIEKRDVDGARKSYHWAYNWPVQGCRNPWLTDEKGYPTVEAAMAAAKAFIENFD